jgi:hypothetical protein
MGRINAEECWLVRRGNCSRYWFTSILLPRSPPHATSILIFGWTTVLFAIPSMIRTEGGRELTETLIVT